MTNETVSLDPDAKARIDRFLIAHLGIATEQMTSASNIIDDLGGDSLDKVEICMAIEEMFIIEITDDEAENLETVGDWYGIVAAKTR